MFKRVISKSVFFAALTGLMMLGLTGCQTGRDGKPEAFSGDSYRHRSSPRTFSYAKGGAWSFPVQGHDRD